MPLEIDYMREAMDRVEMAVCQFENAIEPGKMEAELWAEFHHGLVRTEGLYVSTRLMQSGSNTFPYFQECGDKRLQKGDLICLDTDALGFQGYAVDFPRTYVCGDVKPTSEEKLLNAKASEQLEHNISIIQSGKSYQEIAEQAWSVPQEYQASCYYCIGHGLGMSGERSNIPYKEKGKKYPLHGVIEPGMVICIESYIGSEVTKQGVKLEQQLLIGENSVECMSNASFDRRLEL